MALPEIYTTRMNELMSKLPNNPFVIDIIGKAAEISYTVAEEANTVEDFDSKLSAATTVADYATKTSQPNFYKYALIAGTLLIGVAPEAYTVVDTTSGTVRNTAQRLTDILNADTWFTKCKLMNDLAADNIENMVPLLVVFSNIVEELTNKGNAGDLTIEDRYILLGMAYVETHIKVSGKFNINNDIYPYHNRFMGLIYKNKFI
jgi:hypothetical protein